MGRALFRAESEHARSNAWLGKVIQTQGNPKVIVELAAGLKSELITTPSNPTPNPHIWLDPQLAAHGVTNILQALVKADPANAPG